MQDVPSLEKTRQSLSRIHESLITLATILSDLTDQVRELDERMKNEVNFRDQYLKGKYQDFPFGSPNGC